MGDQKTTMLLIILSVATVMAEATKVEYSVACSDGAMVVRVAASGVEGVELEKWGEHPGCGASLQDAYYMLTLPLDDELVCGTTKVKNKITNEIVYYHRVTITSNHKRKVMLVKCRVAADNSTIDNIVKRDVLPPEFEEPDYIEITSEVSGTAPVPILGVGVRQDGNLVGGQVTVRPGTPLTMEVYLDDVSAGTYGILMSFMEVTDNHKKRETIIFNGCSVDPNLFDNFITTSGDYVSARFRAFKFPETHYLHFRGTIDVCLDKCQGIACSNGQLGYGRRRRGVDSQSADPNKLFEVTMTTFVKVNEESNGTMESSLTILEDDVFKAESMAEEIAESMAKNMVALERATEDSYDAPSWNPSADYISERSSSGNEPTFIYFNSGHTQSYSLILAVIAFLLIFSH